MLATVALALVLGLAQPAALRHRLGSHVLDIPNSRSSHAAPVPRIGGVILVVAVASGVAAGSADLRSELTWLIVAFAAGVAAIGLVDDVRHGISPGIRLLAQLTLSLGASLWLVDALDLTVVGCTAVVIGASLWLAGFTNAFNFMDGINGIALLTALVSWVWYLGVAAWLGMDGVTVVAAAMAAACAGLLPWNAGHAYLFLGDSGSYFLGSALAATALVTTIGGAPVAVSVAPLLPFCADSAWTLARRVLGRRGVGPHREHAYQRLVDLGFGHLQVGVSVAGLAALCCIWVAATQRGPAGLMMLLPAALCALYLAAPAIISRRRDTEGEAWSPPRS